MKNLLIISLMLFLISCGSSESSRMSETVTTKETTPTKGNSSVSLPSTSESSTAKKKTSTFERGMPYT